MQRGSFVSAQVVVEHNHFDLGTIGQVGWLIDGDATVFHLGFQRVHAIQSSIACHLSGIRRKNLPDGRFCVPTRWGSTDRGRGLGRGHPRPSRKEWERPPRLQAP